MEPKLKRRIQHAIKTKIFIVVTRDNLSSGDHVIYFRVRDDRGDWSEMDNEELTIRASLPDWDVNMDGRVNVLDMILVGNHFGEEGEPHWIRADVNRMAISTCSTRF